MNLSLLVNGQSRSAEAPAEKPLLWVLREDLGLLGTKFGCGVAQCGACTVLVDGRPIRSCITPASSVQGRLIRTIEGLSRDGSHPVQRAWVAGNVPQCGYCQSGQILAAVALLESAPHPSDEQIDAAMSGNICRCGTYQRIRQAIHAAAGAEGGNR